jgi:hypothetical protein
MDLARRFAFMVANDKLPYQPNLITCAGAAAVRRNRKVGDQLPLRLRFWHDVLPQPTFRISDPAPVMSRMKPRRNRGVHCIRLVRRFVNETHTEWSSFRCELQPDGNELRNSFQTNRDKPSNAPRHSTPVSASSQRKRNQCRQEALGYRA